MKSLVLSLMVMSSVVLFVAMGQATQVKDYSLVLYLPFDEGSGDKIKDASIYQLPGMNGYTSLVFMMVQN